MGDDHHGHSGIGEAGNNIKHFADELGVKGAGRLVEQHDFGVHRQRPRNGNPLALTSRELVRPCVSLFLQPDPFQKGHGVLFRVPPGKAEDSYGTEREIIQNRKVGKEIELLEYHSHQAGDVAI
jgi:hypothetical protein